MKTRDGWLESKESRIKVVFVLEFVRRNSSASSNERKRITNTE